MDNLLAPDAIVEATVTRIEVYGIYLSHDQQDIFVQIPEVSWFHFESCRSFTCIGDRHAVIILWYVPEKKMYVGSFKQANPDANPWREPLTFEVGSVWKGRVTHEIYRNRDDRSIVLFIVEIKRGVAGALKVTPNTAYLKKGDKVTVVIKSINRDRQEVELERVGYGVDCPEGATDDSPGQRPGCST
jgi:ribosomal protein S1